MSLTKQDKQDVQDIVNKSVNKAVDDLSEIIAGLAQNMHNEITDLRHDNLTIKSSIDRLTNTIDGFVKRLDDAETEATFRDAQFDRLLVWAKKVSVKTGIPLKDL